MTRKFSLMFIGLVALMLAACGGGGNTGGGGGGGVSLTETFDGDEVMFKYPSGWVISPPAGPGGPISVANNQAALDAATTGSNVTVASGQQMVMVMPLTGDAAAAMTALGDSPIALLTTVVSTMNSAELTFGEPTETTIGGNPAARASGSGDGGDGQVIAINMGDAGYVFVIGATGKGEMSSFEGTLNAVTESVSLKAAG